MIQETFTFQNVHDHMFRKYFVNALFEHLKILVMLLKIFYCFSDEINAILLFYTKSFVSVAV